MQEAKNHGQTTFLNNLKRFEVTLVNFPIAKLRTCLFVHIEPTSIYNQLLETNEKSENTLSEG
jgi:hypothetical protein